MGKSSIGGKYEGIRRILATGPYRNFVRYSGNPICPITQSWEQWNSIGAQEDPKILVVGNTRYMFSCAMIEEAGVVSPFGDLAINIGVRTQALTDPPQTWTPYAGNPIILHGTSGTWNYPFIASPNVIPMPDGSFRMYMHGYGYMNGMWADRIGIYFCSAANFPGGPWVEHPGNPVLDVGPNGSWDYLQLQIHVVIPPFPVNPHVSYSSDGLWHMVYGGTAGSNFWAGGHATSPDGLTWTKDSLNPVWLPDGSGGWDSGGVLPLGPSLLINGIHHIMFQSPGTNGSWRIGVAGTADFRTFVPSPLNPIYVPGPSGARDSGSVEGPGLSLNAAAGTLDLFTCCSTAPNSAEYVICTARSTFPPFA